MRKSLLLGIFSLTVLSANLNVSAFAEGQHQSSSVGTSDSNGGSPIATFFQRIGEWFKKVFTSDSKPHKSAPGSSGSVTAISAPRALPLNEKLIGHNGRLAYLGAVRSKQPATQPGRIEVSLPQDRCKAGILRFGEMECAVLGRGMTEQFPVAGYVQGQHNNGQTCYYKPTNKSKGATPTGLFRVSGVRPMRPDKPHWGRDGWRLEPLSYQPPIGANRDGFVLHSDQKTGGNIDYRPTWGCLKVDQQCQEVLDKYIHQYRNSGKGVTINVQEI